MQKHILLAAALAVALLAGCSAGENQTSPSGTSQVKAETGVWTSTATTGFETHPSEYESSYHATELVDPSTTAPAEPQETISPSSTEHTIAETQEMKGTEETKETITHSTTTHIHNFSAGERVAPSCESGGFTWYICSQCGEREKREVTEKTGHTWGAWTQTAAPDCKREGKENRTCTACGKQESRTVKKTDHTWSPWQTIQNAACTEPGIRESSCSGCGAKRTEEIKPLGHDFKFVQTIAPTSSAGGYDLYRCSLCGTEEHRNETEKLAASLDYAAAMKAADRYAKDKYKCTIGDAIIQQIGYQLTPENASYFPPDDIPKYILTGQSDLESRAKAKMESLLQLFLSRGESVEGLCVRCYITEIDGAVWIYILY